MANRKIYADLSSAQLMENAFGSVLLKLDQPSKPGQYDALQLTVQPMRQNPTGNQAAPFELLNAGDYTVTALVVASNGSTLAGPMATWNPDGDAKVGSIDLNTAAMATAMTGQSSIDAILEIKFDNGSDDRTSIQLPFKIQKSYISPGTPSELPLARYPTWEEALQKFVQFYGNPDGATITLEKGGKQTILGAGSDSSFKGDAL